MRPGSRHFLLLLIVSCAVVHAQPLALDIRSIDASDLPRIRLKVALHRGGAPVGNAAGASFVLTENGRRITPASSCPDSAGITAVALVLDNSGSMGGSPFDSARRGAHAVIDSLRPGHLASLYRFTNGGEQVLPFTSDTALLHAAVRGLGTAGGTPLYRTMKLAITDLAALPPGRKFCIALTDGLDNGSGVASDELVPLARSAGIRVYTIGYGNTKLSDRILSDIARGTGGVYYRIFSPAEMTPIFHDIAGDLVSQLCDIEYDSDGCTDSLRLLTLEAGVGAETARADTMYASPFRSDSLAVRVVAPRRVAAGQTAIVYLALSQPLHTGLRLSYSVLLRHDPRLLQVNPVLPITVGTVSQNASVGLRVLRPGVLRFDADVITPGLPSGNLVGVAFRALAADSSRPVALVLDSMELSAGCPNVVSVGYDTIEVCQCADTLVFRLDTMLSVSAGDVARLPLDLPALPDTPPSLLRLTTRFDDGLLRFAGVEGCAFEQLDGEDVALVIHPGRGERPTLLFTARPQAQSRAARLSVSDLVLYGSCCTHLPGDSAVVYIDGYCESLLARRGGPGITAYPNPARDVLTIALRTDADVSHCIVSLVGTDGVPRFEEALAPVDGSAVLQIPVADLTPGVYIAVLRAGKTTTSRVVTILP
ncbi:MAG: VWA domain-containing protein [Ignavibacteriae bacterium]|nr:VWA domain-containing protein [Ignavibacteriota bacterium]